MNDLNQIRKANQASVTHTAIKATRAAGKFAIAKYDGLSLVEHFEAVNSESANMTVMVLREHAGVSERFEILAPTH